MPEGAKVLVTLDVEADKFITQMGQVNKLIENAVKALKQYERMTVAMSIMKQFEKAGEGAGTTEEAMKKTREAMGDISKIEDVILGLDEAMLEDDKQRKALIKAKLLIHQKTRSEMDAERALTTDQTRQQWTSFIAISQILKATQSIWTSTKAWAEWTGEVSALYNEIFEPMMDALYPLLDALAPVFEAIGNFFDALGPAGPIVAALVAGFMWLLPTIIKIAAYMGIIGKTSKRIELSEKKLNYVRGAQRDTYRQMLNMNARQLEGVKEITGQTKKLKKSNDDAAQAGAAAAGAAAAAAATGGAPGAAAGAAAPTPGVPPEVRAAITGGGETVGTYRGKGRKGARTLAAKATEAALQAERKNAPMAELAPKKAKVPSPKAVALMQKQFGLARSELERFKDEAGETAPPLEQIQKLAAKMRMQIQQGAGGAAEEFAAAAASATDLTGVETALNETSRKYILTVGNMIKAQKDQEEGVAPNCLVSAYNQFAESQKVVIAGTGQISKAFVAQKREFANTTKTAETASQLIKKASQNQTTAVNSSTDALKEDATGAEDAKKSGKGFMKGMKGGMGTVKKLALGFGALGVGMVLLEPIMEILQPIFEALAPIFEAILVPLQPFIDWLTQACEAVLPMVTFWIQKLQEFLAPLVLMFDAWVKSLPPGFVEGVLGGLAFVLQLITMPLKILVDLVMLVAKGFAEWAIQSGWLQGVLEGLHNFLVFIKPILDFLGTIVYFIVTGVSMLVNFLISLAVGFAKATSEGGPLCGIFKVLGIIAQAIGLAMQFIGEIIEHVVIPILNIFGAVFGAIFKAALIVFGIVWNIIATAIEFIANILIGIFNALMIPVNILRGAGGLPPIIIPFVVVPKVPLLDTGGLITKGGLFALSPGERVIPAETPPGPVTNNFEIHATIRSEADIYELARKISEMQEDRYSRNRVAYAGR